MELAERVARRHLTSSGMVVNIVKSYRKYRDEMKKQGDLFKKEIERAFPDTRIVTYFGIDDECVLGYFYLEAEGGEDPLSPQDEDFPGEAILKTAESILGVKLDRNKVKWKRDSFELTHTFSFLYGR